MITLLNGGMNIDKFNKVMNLETSKFMQKVKMGNLLKNIQNNNKYLF